MKNSITTLLLFIFSGCSKDDNTALDPINCLGTADIPLGGIPKCDNSGTMMYLCEVLFVGNFTLDPSSKKYMPLYCNDNGTNLIYQNNVGNQIALSLQQKRYFKTASTFNTFQPCPSDSLRSIGYCIINDKISYNLRSDSLGLELMISLETIPDIYKTTVGYVGDVLEILRKKSANSYTVDFSAVVSQRTLSYDKRYNQENYDDIEILGASFKNVISNDVSKYSTPHFKYYYNNELGLIAFRDTLGITWKIKN